MLIPCKKLFYAVEAVLYIAYNSSSHPVSSREIASQQGLPPRYLEQIMQRLVHGGVLRGVRGPKGGYILARERRRITVGEICKLLEEDETSLAKQPLSTALGNNVVRPLWEKVSNNMHTVLGDITIADLCGHAQKQEIGRNGTDKMDFTI